MEGDVTAELTFNGSVSKTYARDRILESIKSTFPVGTVKPNVLTFMGTEPVLEKNLYTQYGSEGVMLTSLEIDPKRFVQQQNIIDKQEIDIRLRLEKDLDYFKNKRAHNVVWLDYCGPRTTDVHQAIDNVFANGLDMTSGKALMAITLMAARENDFISQEAESPEECEHARMFVTPFYWNTLASKHKLTITPQYYYRYCEKADRTGSPMIVYIFEVTPGIKEVQFDNVKTFHLTSTIARPQRVYPKFIKLVTSDLQKIIAEKIAPIVDGAKKYKNYDIMLAQELKEKGVPLKLIAQQLNVNYSTLYCRFRQLEKNKI